jgi:hypothetical protein
MYPALLILLLTVPACALCNLTGVWNGGGVDIAVVQDSGGSFFATAENGAYTNAPGVVFENNTVQLDCCLPSGIDGLVSGVHCTRIDWSDGHGSVWTRPPPPMPRNVTLRNDVPRVDDTGAILRVQDGCLSYFNGVFYLYGARYQCCPKDEQAGCYSPCGWVNTTFSVYVQ